jgi:Flp pilus assembly protein TadD
MARYKAKLWATGAAVVALAASSQVLSAQEIVQPLPPPGSQELSAALQRLADDGNDVSALLDAGDAAIKLGDVTAAIGFFGRAQALTPSNPRISLGLARAYTMSRRPVEALRLFAEAEKGGISQQVMAAERGLAFDLVGDARTAQEFYRIALAAGAGEEVRRNLALSQAISGDKAGFEATLLPLLEQGDFAAFRTRSFGLAILGETDAAIKIARDMMPGQMASRVEPYLRYMARLTPAQQAAAGALGVFPGSASIGEDDAQIAAYTPIRDRPASSADSRLEPAGQPLGPQRPSSSATRPAEQQPISPRQSAAVRAAAPASRTESVSSVKRTDELPAVTREPATQPVDMGQQPVRQSPTPPPPPRRNVEQAFAAFDLNEAISTAPRNGAVDIRTIDAPRETDEPAAPVHPPRHWVQVATGRDISALGFDWRRISRSAEGELAGKSAYTAPWGEANRLLAGPYDTVREARDVVGRLKAIGLDSFPFSSASGEEVFPLDGASPAPAAEKPDHPSRHWVQVATGRNRDALGFDWRRISRGAEGALDAKGPFVAEWGETNRLLAGPYPSASAARDMVNRLMELGLDSFPFTSDEGEVVETLD